MAACFVFVHFFCMLMRWKRRKKNTTLESTCQRRFFSSVIFIAIFSTISFVFFLFVCVWMCSLILPQFSNARFYFLVQRITYILVDFLFDSKLRALFSCCFIPFRTSFFSLKWNMQHSQRIFFLFACVISFLIRRNRELNEVKTNIFKHNTIYDVQYVCCRIQAAGKMCSGFDSFSHVCSSLPLPLTHICWNLLDAPQSDDTKWHKATFFPLARNNEMQKPYGNFVAK